MIRKTPDTAALAHRLQPQMSRMAINSSTDVISMVRETAMPYAEAS